MNLFKKIIQDRKRARSREELEEQFWEESLWNKTYFEDQELQEPEEEQKTEEISERKKEPFTWESLSDKRNYLKVSDPYQREKYIRSMVEQIKNASAEIDKMSYEYNVVTAALKDMDELEALPENEKKRVEEWAKKIVCLEKETSEYEKKKNRMPEAQYYKMEQYEDSASDIYDEMKKSEHYRELVCDDLSRLDSEKEAYSCRLEELSQNLSNCKGMVIISLVAMVLLYGILLIMQFFFQMKVGAGYAITTIAGTVAATFLYMKYMDEKQERLHIEKRRNRIILLQNTVKIRYVNNINLLDYLYLKYQVKSAREWKQLMDFYQEEKDCRAQNEENGEHMNDCQRELLRILRCYQLSDARIWLHRPLALCDHKEMVEIRHEHIVRRQKLRAQMDYNRRLVKDGERALKDFQQENPEYAEEVCSMKDRYQL